MVADIKAPHFPESVEDGTIMTWYKKEGDPVRRDEKIADIETDKVVLEVASPADGVITQVKKKEGETVLDEEVIAELDTEAKAESTPETDQAPPAQETPVAEEPSPSSQNGEQSLSPAVRKLVAEHKLDIGGLAGTGKGGRITKADVLGLIEKGPAATPAPEPQTPAKSEPPPAPSKPAPPPVPTSYSTDGRPEERVPMSRLRARIAERLVEVQQQTAMLTTFNEVNMQPVIDLRAKFKDRFLEEHGVKLGFMSFFVKASVEALKQFPAINGSVDGKDIVYHGYFDIGIAVSSERGLVVPVVRNADLLSFGQIEASIENYAKRAQANELTLDELQGGTFTLTNGGIFGSMLSTPILNPPQSAILGMHTIQPRPVAEDGNVVIRPMMYLALSYDHRIVDGKEAVQFLVTIKNVLEDPARLLLQV